MSVSGEIPPSLYEASIAGGLTSEEAQDISQIYPDPHKEGYKPYELPVLGAYLNEKDETIQNRDGKEVDNPEDYINELLQEPENYVESWKPHPELMDDFHDIENGKMRAKRDEYALRTILGLECSLSQDFIDKSLAHIVNQDNYTSNASQDLGDLGLVIGQYLEEIRNLTDNKNILDEAYETMIEGSNAPLAVAASNVPVDTLPEESYRNNEYFVFGGEDLEKNKVQTRLRNMIGAGRCHHLDRGHNVTFLEEDPSKNATLITLDGEIVGSLKYDGNPSMMALKDLTHNGRQVLQKGWAYRISHNMMEDIGNRRAEEDQEIYEDWEVVDFEEIRVRPLRSLEDIKEVREDIDEKKEELRSELSL